jgi:hypothetical protein
MLFPRAPGVAAVVGTLVLSTLGAGAQVPDAGVSLKISMETAPPGSIVQMKVRLTEPQPIVTGRALLSFPGFDIEGIAGSRDSAGMAVVRGGEIALSVLSTGAFAMDPDYPALLTVTVRVPPDAPPDTLFPMTLDRSSLELVDLTGAVYPAEIKDGYLLTTGDLSTGGGAISVSDVVPGSAALPAGSTLSIFGTGFRRHTRVKLKETLLAQVMYVNPGQINVVLAEPARMHGKAIRVRNEDGSEVTYFSYQRTRPSGSSADPVLRDVVPMFPAETSSLQGSVQLADTTVGIAVQNLEATDTLIFAELIDGAGGAVAAGQIEVPANSYVVRAVSEIFGLPYSGTGQVRLVGVSPVQILGVDVDPTGAVSPRLPQ